MYELYSAIQRFRGAKNSGLIVTCLKVQSCHVWKDWQTMNTHRVLHT